MLAMMRLCAPRSRQLLLTSCLLGHNAPNSRLLINPSFWNRTFATGTRKTNKGGPAKDQQKVKAADEVISIERVPKDRKGFTAEEDALIVQRVSEWGDKGPGLWVNLTKEIGRTSTVIARRYRTAISPDRSAPLTVWTPVVDARLTEGVKLYKEKEGWARVVEYVGSGITALQCKNRWNRYLSKTQQGGIKQGEWTEEEERKLKKLVSQHVIKPHWSEQYNVMTKERIDWTAIGNKLHRIPRACSVKWDKLKASKLKQSPFKTEVDVLIAQGVVELGDTTCKLQESAVAHTIEPEYSESLQSMTKRTTDLTTIGTPLAVDPKKCKAKRKDRGKSRAEEDALVAQTVTKWEDKIGKLEELVAAHTAEPEYSESLQGMTKRRTDWTTIGRLLAVDPKKCKAKWRTIQDRGKTTGHFTAKEDALIAQRVAEWGDKGPGLWASLEREMGTRADVISRRYKTSQVPDEGPSARTIWTAVLDSRLTEGVALYMEKEGWARVAEYVGGEVTDKQCKNRWSSYLGDVQQAGNNQGGWTRNEMRQLVELVPHCVVKPYWSEQYKVTTQERIDWTAIAEQLNRIPSDCRDKWHALQGIRRKKGPFTAEQDALILKRVAEWGDEGNGLWVSLQEEMGRGAKYIRTRYTTVLATRDVDWVPKESSKEQTFTPLLDREKSKFEWSPDMDARLKEGVANHNNTEGWAGVAKFVGDSVTANQCVKRWQEHVSKVQQEGAVRRGKWTDNEVEELLQLVPQHVIESHWSEDMGVMTQERIAWEAIADKLNRFPKDCKSKWRNLRDSKLKKGPFAAEETDLISRRVAEWGEKGSGLWVSLEKELGRSPESISKHWKSYLKTTHLEPNIL